MIIDFHPFLLHRYIILYVYGATLKNHISIFKNTGFSHFPLGI
jgi:hypothetical protein